MTSKYDLVVLGSGPAGQRAAVQAAKLGRRVLVVEKDSIGGSCLHTGTIPSKTLRQAVLSQKKMHSQLLKQVMKQKDKVIDAEALLIAHQLDRNQVQFVKGMGSFLDANTIQIKNSKTQTVSADRIIIATGTRPHRPVKMRFDSRLVFDSDSILHVTKKPNSLLVLGAGVIGCEYASIFARMGVAVTLADRRTGLLRGIDDELTELLQRQFSESGIKCKLGCPEYVIEKTSPKKRKIKADIGEGMESFDALLYCMGRVGNFEQLNLSAAGLVANSRGLIDVNTHYQSRVPHIYAVGDIIGSPALASSSAEQGRLAAAHAFGQVGGAFPKSFPFGIYTIPEISSAGALESDLKKNGVNYIVGRAQYRELARGKILEDEHGLLKLIVDASDGTILGVHVLGEGATELVHIGQVAMALGAKVDFLVQNVFNYPTLAEAYKVAALNAFNQLSSLKKLTHLA